MSQTLGSLPVGAKIKEKDTKYLGKPIVWLKADSDHTDYPSGTSNAFLNAGENSLKKPAFSE